MFYRGMIAAAALAVSTAASATGFTLVAVSTGPGAYNFNISDSAKKKGTFTDTFSFMIPTDSGSSLQAALINIAVPKSSGDINFLDAMLTGPGLSETLDVTNVGSQSSVFTSNPLSVMAGASYLLSVHYSAGGKNASFNGNISVQPIPEMLTWTMLIVGMGAVGMTMRRRKSFVPAMNAQPAY
jgi:hypothetical protein